MKAKDLMIGDWVLDPWNNPLKLELLDFKLYGKFPPIPLTKEILEKNGFDLKSDGWLWCEDKEVETQNYISVQFRHNGEVRIVEINFLNKAVTKFRTIQYVHELQHALRLCGIDKEIKL